MTLLSKTFKLVPKMKIVPLSLSKSRFLSETSGKKSLEINRQAE